MKLYHPVISSHSKEAIGHKDEYSFILGIMT